MQYLAAEVTFPRVLRNKNGTIRFSSFRRIQRYIICHEKKSLKLSHLAFSQIMCQEQCQAFRFFHIWILLIFMNFLVYHTWWQNIYDLSNLHNVGFGKILPWSW